MTRLPSRAKARAAAAPIPVDAPVMRTVLPLRSDAIRSPRGYRLSLKRRLGRRLLQRQVYLWRPSGFRVAFRAKRICTPSSMLVSAPSMPPPKLRVPADACDCHMHVYEDRFPPVPQATFKPPHAPLSDYLQVQRRLGFSRAVIV